MSDDWDTGFTWKDWAKCALGLAGLVALVAWMANR